MGKAARIVDAVAALDDLVLPLLSTAFPDPVEAEELRPSVDLSTVVSADVDVLVAWGSFAQGPQRSGRHQRHSRGSYRLRTSRTALQAVRSVQVSPAPQVSPVQLVSDWIGELDERDAAIPATGSSGSNRPRWTRSACASASPENGFASWRVGLVERVNTLLSGSRWTVVRWAVHQLRVGLGAYAPGAGGSYLRRRRLRVLRVRNPALARGVREVRRETRQPAS